MNSLETLKASANPFCRCCRNAFTALTTKVFCVICKAIIQKSGLGRLNREIGLYVPVTTSKNESPLSLASIMLSNLKQLRLSHTKEGLMDNRIYQIGTQQVDLIHDVFPIGTDPSLLSILVSVFKYWSVSNTVIFPVFQKFYYLVCKYSQDLL